MSKYSSPYPLEVTYRSDKNFIVRLKAMIERNMKNAGYSTSHNDEKFMKLIELMDNAEDYLFDQSDPTPSSTEVKKSLRERINEAHIGLAHFLTDNVSTHIREGFNGWQVGFTVQQQTFYLQPVSADKGDEGDTEEKARWYQTCLETALSKIINNEYDVIDDMLSEQKRWIRIFKTMANKQKPLHELMLQVETFNLKHSLGDSVKLRLDSGEVKEVTIKHPATILGGHTAVGWFNGVSGCYNLNNVIEN